MWLFHKDCQSSRVEVLSASPPGLRYRYERGNVAGDSAEASKVMCAHMVASTKVVYEPDLFVRCGVSLPSD